MNTFKESLNESITIKDTPEKGPSKPETKKVKPDMLKKKRPTKHKSRKQLFRDQDLNCIKDTLRIPLMSLIRQIEDFQDKPIIITGFHPSGLEAHITITMSIDYPDVYNPRWIR